MRFQQLRSWVIWLSSLPTTYSSIFHFFSYICFYSYLRKWHIYKTAKMPFRGKLTKMPLNIRFSSFSFSFLNYTSSMFSLFSFLFYFYYYYSIFLFFLYDMEKMTYSKDEKCMGHKWEIKCHCKIGCDVSTTSILYIRTWYLTTFSWKSCKTKVLYSDNGR